MDTSFEGGTYICYSLKKLSFQLSCYSGSIYIKNLPKLPCKTVFNTFFQCCLWTWQLFQVEMFLFGNKISHKIENHSKLSQKLWYFGKIKSSWKLISFFCFQKKLNFGCDPCLPCFCLNKALKEQFSKVLATFSRTTAFKNNLFNHCSMCINWFEHQKSYSAKLWVFTLVPQLL